MQAAYLLVRIQPSSPTPEIVLVRRQRAHLLQQAALTIQRFLHVGIAIRLCANDCQVKRGHYFEFVDGNRSLFLDERSQLQTNYVPLCKCHALVVNH